MVVAFRGRSARKPVNTGKLVTGSDVLWRKEIKAPDPNGCRGWGQCEWLLCWLRWLGTASGKHRTEAKDPQC